jgi:hypothetical protein
MEHVKTTFFSAIILMTLFSGCIGQNSGCSDPYVKIGDSCCVDGDGNGVCDKEETQATTTMKSTSTILTTSSSTTTQAPATTTLVSTVETTSTAAGTTTTLKTCKSASDCGLPYLGGCTCQGEGVTKTIYKAVCNSGTCTYRGETEIDRCATGSEKEHCVSGYAKCITDDDYREYFVVPEDADLLTGLLSDSYSAKYLGYRFKTNNVLFPEDSRCFDDLRILIGVTKPNGKETEIVVLRNAWGRVDDIEVGLDSIKRTINGSIAPTLWVREV